MANPQKENGYTPIANELVEALAHTKFTENETQALFLIFRNTYGWNRKVWQIKKWKEFEDIGIHKANVKQTLLKLAIRQIIKLNWQQKLISFQKDYTLWQKPIRIIKSKNKVSQLTNFLSHNFDENVSQLTNKKLVNQLTQVSQLTNFGSCNSNDDKDLPAPKTNIKQENKYIYSDQARELRHAIMDKFSIKIETKGIPTQQFLIDLLKLYDKKFIEQKISELPVPMEYTELSRTLRYYCEHPNGKKPEQATPYKNAKQEFLDKKAEAELMKATLGVVK